MNIIKITKAYSENNLNKVWFLQKIGAILVDVNQIKILQLSINGIKCDVRMVNTFCKFGSINVLK